MCHFTAEQGQVIIVKIVLGYILMKMVMMAWECICHFPTQKWAVSTNLILCLQASENGYTKTQFILDFAEYPPMLLFDKIKKTLRRTCTFFITTICGACDFGQKFSPASDNYY